MHSTSQLLIGLLVTALLASVLAASKEQPTATAHAGAAPSAIALNPHSHDPGERPEDKPENAERKIRSANAAPETHLDPGETGLPEPGRPDQAHSSDIPRIQPADPGSWLWPRLTPPPIRATQVTVALRGHDPAGPRRLELWRIDTPGPERIGGTESATDGTFNFGRIPLPQAELSLVVTPPGVDPASVTPLRLRRPALSRPDVRVEYKPGGMQAKIIPARLEGELEIRNEADQLVWVLPVRGEPVRVDLGHEDLTGSLRVTHVLPNGERSFPRLFHTPAPSLPSVSHWNAPRDSL
ncbi:MAG: hypothetical protein VX252_11935 [Myxococcota bacterium]|nr:hypothetical protein [Myxococcota bacterium]